VTGGEGTYHLTVPVNSQAQVYAWAQQVQQAQVIVSQARR
jgi:dethiobiotin synthetase